MIKRKNLDYFESICKDDQYLTRLCNSLPFNTIKIIRPKMNLMEKLLIDPDLKNLQIVYLARDPRAIMASRRQKNVKGFWCTATNVDCSDTGIVCDDLRDDVDSTRELMRKYPGQVHFLRLEDIALNPSMMVRDIYDALGMKFEEKTLERTKDSEEKITKWSKSLRWADINEIQLRCKEVMSTLGYKMVNTVKNIKAEDVIEPLAL